MKKIFLSLGLLLTSLFCFFGFSSKDVSALSIDTGLSGNIVITAHYSYYDSNGALKLNSSGRRVSIHNNSIDLIPFYDNLINYLSSSGNTLLEITSLDLSFVNPLYIDNFNFYIRFDTTSSYLYHSDEGNIDITTQFGKSNYLIQYNNNTIVVSPSNNSTLSNSNISLIRLYEPWSDYGIPEQPSKPQYIKSINFQTDLTESTILNQLSNLQSKYDSLLNDYNALNDRYQSDLETKYNEGYNLGYSEGVNSSNSLGDLMITVADTPISIFKSIFDFNVLGFNLNGFVFSLISLSIVIWLIKRFI